MKNTVIKIYCFVSIKRLFMVDTRDHLPSTLIPYQEYIAQALRGVVRRVLESVMQEGPPGEHHFYIRFSTTHPLVNIPDFLRTQYPETLKIVLQHQFSGLRVDDEGFHINLVFNGTPAKLYVPFAAMEEFADPEAQFALQFDSVVDSVATDEEDVTKTPADDKLNPQTQTPETTHPNGETDGENVVSLDAFRKK